MNKNHDIYKGFTESDWKLFSKKTVIWQENINKLNEEYITILSQDKNPSDKFWELEARIKKDKRNPGVVLDMRRSTMILNIIKLLNDEVIRIDDLNEFSDTLKETIQLYRQGL